MWCRRLRRPSERWPAQDEKSDARKPTHRVLHQPPSGEAVQGTDHGNLVVIAVAKETGVLLDLIAKVLEPPYLRLVRSTTPAIIRGEFAILDWIARAEELLRDSTDTLGEQAIRDERQRIQGWEEMKGDPPGPQERIDVAMETARVPHVLGQHLGEDEIERAPHWYGLAADVRDDLVISCVGLGQLRGRDVEQAVSEGYGVRVLEWKGRVRAAANLADAPAVVALDQPLERGVVAGIGVDLVTESNSSRASRHRATASVQQSALARAKTMTGDTPALLTLTRPFRRVHIVPMVLPVLRGPFTVESYQRLAELGVLGENDRVELIDGQVVEMTPIGDRHASCVRRLLDWFAHHALELAIIDVQNTVVLGRRDAPQPDLALLKRRADGYPQHPRPRDILLVIEVADSTLAYDRDVKGPLYARAGIPEFWLVNLPADRIDVHRQPGADRYADVRAVSRGETISPLHFPNVTLATNDILG